MRGVHFPPETCCSLIFYNDGRLFLSLFLTIFSSRDIIHRFFSAFSETDVGNITKTFFTDLESLSGDDVDEQLAIAEREFLEARASYTVRSKATRTVLMTDPILKAVHSKATIPPER